MDEKINILEFTIKWTKARIDNPNWRSGQACFNTLNNMYPNLANRIRMTELDMYYWNNDNPKWTMFWEWIDQITR